MAPSKAKSLSLSTHRPGMCSDQCLSKLIGKGVHQGCTLLPCLLNLYAEYIMQNTRLDKAQAEVKTAGRNINKLRYADDTALMAESKKELESLDEGERGE